MRLSSFVPFASVIRRYLDSIYEIRHNSTQLLFHTYKQNLLSKLDNPKRLEHYGYRVYSQNDEDGILAEIFKRIGCKNRFFVEFGVQDGLECNSHFLLLQGWSGVFIEGSAKYCKQIQKHFARALNNPVNVDTSLLNFNADTSHSLSMTEKNPLSMTENAPSVRGGGGEINNTLLKAESYNQLTLLNEFITKDNINELLSKTQARQIFDIDLLSIDIDGNDYYVFESISVIAPRVVVVEFNGKFPPPMEWIMPYNPIHMWDYSDNQGASLHSLYLLGKKKGYKLVGTNINGINAFFVREDLCGDRFCDYELENLYNPFVNLSVPQVGHSTRTFLDNAALK